MFDRPIYDRTGQSMIQIAGGCNMERNIAKKAASIALFALTLGVAVTASGVAWASPHKALVDPTSFSTCGTLSASNTIYVLTANIVTASTGNCITLSGNN